jgi:hypothetical protein
MPENTATNPDTVNTALDAATTPMPKPTSSPQRPSIGRVVLYAHACATYPKVPRFDEAGTQLADPETGELLYDVGAPQETVVVLGGSISWVNEDGTVNIDMYNDGTHNIGLRTGVAYGGDVSDRDAVGTWAFPPRV